MKIIRICISSKDSYGYLEIHISLHLSRFFRGRTKPTADPDNAWAISAYGGVPILLDVCRYSGLREEAGVPVIVGLQTSGSAAAKEKAANCIAILASFSEYFRAIIIQEKGLQKLLQLLQVSSNPDTLEQVTGGSNGCRKRLVDAGAQGYLQRLSEMEVAEAKKALQRLSGNRLKNIFSRWWTVLGVI
ncbi:hypothetical protein E3N88_21376 [Mikania micrantha]|uniref:Armadillo repeat-containing domain-containing protein n=1 Tax=Mikania micrantha TaxID=192012 RepID=A0A5N6NLI5_9ASTR|nr:hypothetical protein E3N88_21376 [Mikania micrantha]